ncbi:MAG: flippase [Draconibacterium sp.]
MQVIRNIKYTLFGTANRTKIFRNVSWAVAGKIVNVLYGLIIGVLVARYLGPEQFGLMSYVTSYVTLFSIIATFGMDNIEVRELTKNPENRDVILGSSFSFRLILSFFAIILVLITLLIFESDSFTIIMVMIYSSYLIAGSFNVIKNYFTSILLNEYVVKTEIIRTFFGAGIKGVLLFQHCSLKWFIIANTIDFFLIAGGYVYSYRKKVDMLGKWKLNFSMIKFLANESFPLLLSGAAVVVYQRIDQVMIRNMIDNEALGQFSVALRVADMIIFVPSVIATTITPILVQELNKGYDAYKRKRRQFVDLMIWSSIIMSLFISVVANLMITLLFGIKYQEAVGVLQIMAWKTVGIALSSASGQLIIIEGKQKFVVFRNVIGVILCVAFNFILIPRFGIIGSAWTTLISVFFAGYIANYLIPPFREIFRLQTSSLLLGWRSGLKILKSK